MKGDDARVLVSAVFGAAFSGFVSCQIFSCSPDKLNVTDLLGSESRERKGGVSESGGDGGTRSACVCVQEGYRLCVVCG